jgi:hypothetical protein
MACCSSGVTPARAAMGMMTREHKYARHIPKPIFLIVIFLMPHFLIRIGVRLSTEWRSYRLKMTVDQHPDNTYWAANRRS